MSYKIKTDIYVSPSCVYTAQR